MVFSTTIFLFAFLPLFLAVYYLLPFRHRSVWILTASLAFYGWWRLDFMLLMVLTTVWSHVLCRAIETQRMTAPARARRALLLGVILNIGTLAYFKYFNFGVDSISALVTALGGGAVTAWEVVLPIGISFYVFQASSYLIDVWRGDAEPARNYVDVAAYISLFPQLIAGPIVRYGHIAPQLRSRAHSLPEFGAGARRFMIGFSKKVLIADSVAGIADAAFGLPTPHTADAWIGVLAYAVQIFYDFSGYSDMAIGLGRMIGFRFPENFNRPYSSRSISEFWRRWHMSLSSWLRDYLYIPLGGNRRGRRRTYVNLLTVMLIGGLWHGAAWTFVLWGAWHGTWLALERAIAELSPRLPRFTLPAARRAAGPAARRPGIQTLLGTVYTLLVVLSGWVLFRSPDLAVAGRMLESMFGYAAVAGDGARTIGLSAAMAWQLDDLGIVALLVGWLMAFIPPAPRTFGTAAAAARAAVPAAFILGIIKLIAESYSPFLYFQF